ncbi:MAG: hypothetical protein HRS50_00210 [Mycoplasmataceae bacterium]|nr:hypothetical protein [Mycoplasmataceae bacterium]
MKNEKKQKSDIGAFEDLLKKVSKKTYWTIYERGNHARDQEISELKQKTKKERRDLLDDISARTAKAEKEIANERLHAKKEMEELRKRSNEEIKEIKLLTEKNKEQVKKEMAAARRQLILEKESLDKQLTEEKLMVQKEIQEQKAESKRIISEQKDELDSKLNEAKNLIKQSNEKHILDNQNLRKEKEQEIAKQRSESNAIVENLRREKEQAIAKQRSESESKLKFKEQEIQKIRVDNSNLKNKTNDLENKRIIAQKKFSEIEKIVEEA